MPELQDILSQKEITDIEMSDTYIPIQDKDLSTKKYVDDTDTAMQVQVDQIISDAQIIDGGSF